MSNRVGRPNDDASVMVGLLPYMLGGEPARSVKVTENHCSELPCGSGPERDTAAAPGFTTGITLATLHAVLVGFVLQVRFERQIAPMPSEVTQFVVHEPQCVASLMDCSHPLAFRPS